MDIYSITVDETSGNNEENINAKEAIFELVLDNVIVTYEVIFTENIEQFEVVVSDTKVTYIVEPSTTFFSSGIGDAPDEQLYCRRNGQWVALAPVQSLELGNLHTNAYYGDLGKIAYDHSQATGNPHQLSFSGLSNKPTTVQGYGITDIPAWALSVSKPSYTTSEVTEADNLYFTQSRVLSTIISGYSPVDGNVNSSDSILSAINKLGNNKHLPLTLGSANGLTLDGQQLSLALASGTTTGSLSYSDWTIFNNKQPAGNYSTDIHENITALDNVSGVNTGDQLDILGNAATATRLLNARTINGISFDGTQNIVINAVDSTDRIASSLLGVANGVATLDNNGLVPATQLPSYVDDVVEAVTLSLFPATGETGKIYVAKDTNKTYRWSGSTYVYITSGAVDSVNGYTGIVTLNKSDIGLSNVSNELQWSISNHPTTTSGYGITDIPTYSGSNFILNQNASAQSANMWISGQVRVDNAIFSQINGSDTVGAGARFGLLNSAGNRFMLHQLNASNGEDIWSFDGTSYRNVYSLSYLGAATFASTVNATQFNATVSSDIFTLKLNNSWSNTLTKFSNNGSTGGQNIQVTNIAESANLPLHLQPNGGITTFGGQLQSTVATGTAPLTVNSTTMVGKLNADLLDGRHYTAFITTNGGHSTNINTSYNKYGTNFWIPSSTGIPFEYGVLLNIADNGQNWNNQLAFGNNNNIYFRQAINTSDFSGIVFNNIYHSGNLTNTLSTNYIPKWNGSSMVNSVIMDDGNYWGSGLFRVYYNNTNIELQSFNKDLSLNPQGNIVRIPSTYPSTSPTTGALVVNGGVGVGGNLNVMSRTNLGNLSTGLGIGVQVNTNQQVGGWVFGALYNDGTATKGGILLGYKGLSIPSIGTYNVENLVMMPDGGNVNIGYTTDQGYKLAVNGTGFFNGVVTGTTFQNSDRRLKAEIKSVVGNYEIETMQFEYKDNIGVTRYGYIAQDIQKILPNLVHERPDGMLTVNITDVHSLEIHQLKNRIKTLEEKLYARS